MPLPGRLRKFFAFASLSLLLLVPFAPLLSGPPAKQASRVIVGAQVADGTGGPLRRANVRLTGDRITRVGNFRPRAGEPVVAADGLVLAPGFIDIHNHSSEGLAKDPLAESQISQGITTVILGADGESPWPIGEFVEKNRQAPAALNLAVLVGHATVRRKVMGDDYRRAARPEEIAEMCKLVEQGMREGAIGLSSGLEYEVGGYATTEEMVALARVAARFGGFYMTHIRDEADRMLEALREAIAIGEQARIPVEISHIKMGTVGVWGKAAEAIRLIEEARGRGVDVTADCYPYDAWASTITVLVPNKHYDDPASVERALADVGGAANVLLTECPKHRDYEFRTLEEIAKSQRISPVELFIQIVKDGEAGVVCRSMKDEDIRAFYQQPWVMVASDGGIGLRHPRAAGTFPKVLGRYVREQNWLSLPEAIRKMTSLPVQRLRWSDRGVLRAGMRADLVLFNPATVLDHSTFSHPGTLPEGIEKVLTNGVLVWDAGRATGARPGRVLGR
ncbi:MAG: D-aminoacylase [Acidobacteria bacterium]|nr:D-aminoacylase [Acidobacteriota bacterium]